MADLSFVPNSEENLYSLHDLPFKVATELKTRHCNNCHQEEAIWLVKVSILIRQSVHCSLVLSKINLVYVRSLTLEQ